METHVSKNIVSVTHWPVGFKNRVTFRGPAKGRSKVGPPLFPGRNNFKGAKQHHMVESGASYTEPGSLARPVHFHKSKST